MSPSRTRTPIREAKRRALTHGKAGASLPSATGMLRDPGLSPERRSGGRGSDAPTPYAEANAAVEALLDGVKETLGEQMVGLYLYGSLASGDFDPQTSDIDFLVVTRGR